MTGQGARAWAAVLLAGLGLAAAEAQAQTLSLSPAVVPLSGQFGQSARHTLRLDNGTALTLVFDLEAQDVVVRDGRRSFVPAGEVPGGIAETAVFSVKRLEVPPGQARLVDVTVTVPARTAQRAVIVLFRGLTRIATADRRAPATVSLGTLFTFALTDAVSVAGSEIVVRPQSGARNLAFEQTFQNGGTEPVVVKGMTAILDPAGALIGKLPSRPHRLLPGERGALAAEYAGELPRGRYRAVSTFEFAGRSLTRSAEFQVR